MIDRKDRRMCMTAAWDEVIQFNERYFPGWRRTSEVFYSNALAGEVGEVCNMTKHRAGRCVHISRATRRNNGSRCQLLI
jgi:hypothetical protein